jgi:hypothetical protein
MKAIMIFGKTIMFKKKTTYKKSIMFKKTIISMKMTETRATQILAGIPTAMTITRLITVRILRNCFLDGTLPSLPFHHTHLFHKTPPARPERKSLPNPPALLERLPHTGVR